MSTPRPLPKTHYELLASFRHALRKFLKFSEDAAVSSGCMPQQYQALLAIKGFPGRDHVTVGELAERLQVKHHSAVGLVDRLVAEKFVTRASSEEDARHVHVRLTARGEKVIEKLASAHREQLRIIGPEISRLLRRIAQPTDSAHRGSK